MIQVAISDDVTAAREVFTWDGKIFLEFIRPAENGRSIWGGV